MRHDHESYEPFSGDELAQVVDLLDQEMKEVALVGMYTGMQLNEICSLQIDNIKTVEGLVFRSDGRQDAQCGPPGSHS